MQHEQRSLRARARARVYVRERELYRRFCRAAALCTAAGFRSLVQKMHNCTVYGMMSRKWEADERVELIILNGLVYCRVLAPVGIVGELQSGENSRGL